MKRYKHTIFRIAGFVVFAIAIYFVGERIVENFGGFFALELGWQTIVATLVAGIVYALASLLPITIWGTALGLWRDANVRWTSVFLVYGKSQILKYLPGNVFQFAGRQVLGARRGWFQKSIAVASLIEIILLASAAALIAVVLGVGSISATFELVPRWVLALALARISQTP